MVRSIEGTLNGDGLHVAIVQARFNSLVSERLTAGAIDALVRHGVADASIDHVLVPGAFELAQVAENLAGGDRYDAIICLGAVVRGGTPHFDYVSSAATRGIADVARSASCAVTFGLLTTDTMEQALDRAGGKAGNKGAEAALAALELVNVYRAIDASEE